MLAFSLLEARGDALEHGLHRHAARGVGLRVAEDLRVHDPVGMGAFQVRKGKGLEIVRISQDRGAFVIDVEKGLQIAEVVRLAQRLHRGELEPHAMLFRQGEQHLRLEAALDVQMQLGLRQAPDERFQRHFPGTLPSTPSTYQLIASTSLSVSVLPCGHPDRAVVALDRTGEGMELAGDDLGLPRRHRLLRRLRDDLVDADEIVDAFLHSPPHVLPVRLAREIGLRHQGVVRPPHLDRGSEMGFGRIRGHVGIPAEGIHALVLRRLQHRGRVGVLQQDVGALSDQRLGGLALLCRVVPGAHPHHLGGDLRVHRARAHGVGVDVAHHLRNGEGGDEAERSALRHVARDDAGEVRRLVHARVVDEHVVRGLEAGRVVEEVLREGLRHLERLVHVAERGGEDDLVALGGEIADHALGVGAFGHALHVRGAHLALQLRFHRLAPGVVGEGPAAVADRADVDEADAQRLLRACR